MQNVLHCKNNLNILLICVYMGKLPFWMPAFYISCEYNKNINWLIISNEYPPRNIPENVKFIRMDIEEFSMSASEKLGFDVKMTYDYTYKINDIKVAYGEIFSSEIKGFSFWGYCDIDVVWGDIRKFVTDKMLEEYDVITSRVRRVSGHFCLFRNKQEINTMYRNIKNIKKIMQCRTNYAIDENITDYFMQIVEPFFLLRIIDLFKKQAVPSLKIYWNQVLTTSGAHQRAIGNDQINGFLWKKGKVFDMDGINEFMYIHFHKMKQTMEKIDFNYPEDVQEFHINRKGFFVNIILEKTMR